MGARFTTMDEGTAIGSAPDRNVVGADAASLWTWERWANKPTCFAVARRTKKQIVAFMRRAQTFGTDYPRTLNISDEGKTWFTTELAAWKHRVAAMESSVRATQRELQDARTQLGMAVSRVRALEAASPLNAEAGSLDQPASVGAHRSSSSSLRPPAAPEGE